MTILYATPPRKIGRHEWRMVAYRSASPRFGASCFTDFQWRAGPDEPWQGSRWWPKYDSNDFNHGLPASVAKLYEKHRIEIREHLAAWEVTP